MTPDTLKSMHGELIKEARVGSLLARYARPIIMRAGGLSGGATGAAVGAGLNVAHEALAGEGDYGGAAIRGAAGGALLGAGLGFGTGKLRDISLVTGKRGLDLAAEAGRRTGGAVKQWGQRQLHGFTGGVPKAGPKSIGLAGGAQKERAKVVAAMRDARLKGVTDPAKRKKIQDAAAKKLKSLDSQAEAAREVYESGLTSIPGTIKGLRDPKRLGKAVLRQAKEGPGGLAGAAAIPAAFTLGDIASGEDPATAVAGGLGDAAGMALTAGMPIIPQSLAWQGISSGARGAAKTLRGKKKTPKVSPPPPTDAQQPVVSEAVT